MENLIPVVDTAVIIQSTAKVYYSNLEQHILAAQDDIISVIATNLALVAPPVDSPLVS
jgi:hypothetical protein